MLLLFYITYVFFFFQAEDGIRDLTVTGVQTCALPISALPGREPAIQGAQVRRAAAAVDHALLPDPGRAEGRPWPRGEADGRRGAVEQRLRRHGAGRGQGEQDGRAAALRRGHARPRCWPRLRDDLVRDLQRRCGARDGVRAGADVAEGHAGTAEVTTRAPATWAPCGGRARTGSSSRRASARSGSSTASCRAASQTPARPRPSRS